MTNSAKRLITSTIAFLADLPQDVCERMERIVEAPAIQEGENVLDVGTGTGRAYS